MKSVRSGLILPALRHILSEYGDLLCKSPYSVQMQEKIRTRKKFQKLNADIKDITLQRKTLTTADKTSNFYKITSEIQATSPQFYYQDLKKKQTTTALKPPMSKVKK